MHSEGLISQLYAEFEGLNRRVNIHTSWIENLILSKDFNVKPKTYLALLSRAQLARNLHTSLLNTLTLSLVWNINIT